MFIAESKKSTFTVKNNPLAPGIITRPNNSIPSKLGEAGFSHVLNNHCVSG